MKKIPKPQARPALAVTLLSLSLMMAGAELAQASDPSREIGEQLKGLLNGALEPVDASAKTINVVRARSAPGTGTSSRPNNGNRQSFDVALRTQQSSYRVDEPIRFEVKGNKEFFLYLFNVDPRTEQVTTILPNRFQTDRELKYPGDEKWREVPNKQVEFISDAPGTERIVMVASDQYLDVERLLGSSGTKSVGSLYQSTTAIDWLENALNDAYPAPEGATAKRIEIRAVGRAGGTGNTRRPLPDGVVIEEFDLRILRR